jgi:hypothetical protein
MIKFERNTELDIAMLTSLQSLTTMRKFLLLRRRRNFWIY